MATHMSHSNPASTTTEPVSWSNSTTLDQAAGDEPAGSRPRARADALAVAIGSVDVETMRDHHLALAMAVVELAADGGRPLPWSHDDPTVALLRAAAKLALTAPESTSSAAADLLARLHSAPSD